MVNVQYDEKHAVRHARHVDSLGEVGPTMYGPTRDIAVFMLGREFGANPQRFARPLGDFMPAYEAELKRQS